MSAIEVYDPPNERALSATERERLHAALVECELEIEGLPGGWIADDWARLFNAAVTGRLRPGCYGVHLLPRMDVRLRAYQAGLLDDGVSRRWWHRFTDWWVKW